MIEYQPALSIIISSLMCIVPFALFLLSASGWDIFHLFTRKYYPDMPYLHWLGDIPLPEQLEEAHAELTQQGFVLLGAYEKQLLFSKKIFWSYRHEENPEVFAHIVNVITKPYTQFITAFDDEVVITLNGVVLEVDTDEAVINSVKGSIAETFTYHQSVVESEKARFGIPYTVRSANDFLTLLQKVHNDFMDEMFQAYYFGWRGVLHVWWLGSAILGLGGLVMIYFGRIRIAQAQTLSMVLIVCIVVGIALLGIAMRQTGKDVSRRKKSVVENYS